VLDDGACEIGENKGKEQTRSYPIQGKPISPAKRKGLVILMDNRNNRVKQKINS
jgi:hypothetical protein